MKRTTWEATKIAVLGLGKSGQAAAEVLHTLGAQVLAIDAQEQVVEAFRQNYPQIPVKQLAASAVPNYLSQFQPECCVVSPGIPPHNPLFSWARASHTPLWSEVELAWQIQTQRFAGQSDQQATPPAWLTVTGTNGKTTVVKLLGQILTTAGTKTAVVGNVGSPIVLAAASGDYQALAVELSSFQLHTTQSISALAAVCLNIDQDHLDWHGSAAAYRQAKSRIFERTQKAVVYNQQDPVTLEAALAADVVEGCRAVGISPQVPDLWQLGIVENLLVDRAFGVNPRKEATALATFADLAHFAGAQPTWPLLQDALAAAALARAYGVEAGAVQQGLRDFQPAPHRRQVVGQQTGVTWINDSKATNTHAAKAALQGLAEQSVVWIAGGDAKGQDFVELVAAIKTSLRGVILIGVERGPLRAALQQEAPQVPVVELEPHPEIMCSAVNEAVALSRPGDQVILAPACASWDQFKNYQERGDQFVAAVAALEPA